MSISPGFVASVALLSAKRDKALGLNVSSSTTTSILWFLQVKGEEVYKQLFSDFISAAQIRRDIKNNGAIIDNLIDVVTREGENLSKEDLDNIMKQAGIIKEVTAKQNEELNRIARI